MEYQFLGVRVVDDYCIVVAASQLSDPLSAVVCGG